MPVTIRKGVTRARRPEEEFSATTAAGAEENGTAEGADHDATPGPINRGGDSARGTGAEESGRSIAGASGSGEGRGLKDETLLDWSPDEQPVKTSELSKQSIADLLADYTPSPAEIEEALKIVAERRLATIEATRIAEESEYTNGFKHYFLANPKYPYERILIPGSRSFWAFYRGRILIDSEEKEALIRSACAGRVFDEDLTEPKRCRICGIQWFSTAAHAECQLGH